MELLRAAEPQGLQLFQRPGASIAAVRNFGAEQSSSDYVAFLDADCSIEPDYAIIAVNTLERTGAAATGCEVDIPPQPHWIEAAWHELHHVGVERDVAYLNSGNFFTRRDVFQRLGGFRDSLTTGEDAELGQRYNEAGYRVHASPAVRAVHYGNPQSIGQFYRRMVWHGLGMFGTVNLRRIDKPTAMMALHLLLVLAGIACVASAERAWETRLALLLASQGAVPLMTVLYRMRTTRRYTPLLQGIWLYWLYYLARLQALALIALGRAERYRK